MIEISRALARRFRTILRQSLAVSRSDWPLVLCRAGSDGLILESRRDDVALRYHDDGQLDPDAIFFRSSVLTEFEGRSDEPVTLEQVAFGKGRAQWMDGAFPRVIEFETVTPDSVPAFPEVPKRFVSQPAGFLQALDEAARTTARELGRLALSRIQIKGRNGELVATDGRQLLVQRGFAFSWSEDLLIPRILAFGGQGLVTDSASVGIGRTASHVILRVNQWTFLLAIDTHSRFPDVQAVIPRSNASKSWLQFDPEDAAFLAVTLPKLPGQDDQHSSITLDLAETVAVRAKGEAGPATEVVLARSTSSGPPVRLCMDRRYLWRALKLGFNEVQVVGADKPLLCRDAARIFVWMPLDKENAIPPGPDLLRISSSESQATVKPTPRRPPTPERRKAPMPAGRNPVPDNGIPQPSPDRNGGIVELIEEAEALRAMLQEASARTARLVAALKQQRRQSRALEAAVASLRQLQLHR